ncbi:hypothetical protein [Edaphobacter dinghuensis]|uniref:hypothetical protein n=1 Tax=Edaphobacter dinghuensis TaxID=1560005 RepID=UPI00166D93F9|nr:hypothetical protein [Edaphobacter dinghuensis]
MKTLLLIPPFAGRVLDGTHDDKAICTWRWALHLVFSLIVSSGKGANAKGLIVVFKREDRSKMLNLYEIKMKSACFLYL